MPFLVEAVIFLSVWEDRLLSSYPLNYDWEYCI